jgi:L-ascorbate metabolism protein UlaG (beta-lactamase superfamily)
VTADLTWIGTATVLLRFGGFTVLTDPNFLDRGERAYLGKGLWSRRRSQPARQLADLPPIDVVVVSHVHGDHFDRRARDGLRKDQLVVTTPASARALERWGFTNVVALRTWASHVLTEDHGALTITAAPGRHALGLSSLLLPPVMGSVLAFAPSSGAGLSVYVTGDTLDHDDLREIPQRYPGIDLGLWHLGGTRIPGVLGLGALVTMNGRQGADLLEAVHPERTVPIHHGDYGVFADPVDTFLREVERRGLPGVRPLARGQTVPLPLD